MEFLFKRDNTGEKNSAEGMGKQQNEQPFKAGTSAQIPQRNDFGPEGQGKDSADFPVAEIIFFSSDIVLFHCEASGLISRSSGRRLFIL